MPVAKSGLNRNQLKYIVIAAMLIDHVAWQFVPGSSWLLSFLMHTVGRLTAPCMCFFIAEGYIYTRNKVKYGVRLFVFSIISYLPFYYFEYGSLPVLINAGRFDVAVLLSQSVIFSLFLSFIMLCIINSSMNIFLKIISSTAVFILDMWSDWRITAIIFTVIFYEFSKDRKQQALIFALVAAANALIKYPNILGPSAFQFGTLLFVPLLLCYNGKKGSPNAFHKWFFYIFYPTHLLLLGVIKYVFIK